MAIPRNINPSAFITAANDGSQVIPWFADSLAAGQPSASGQGWDNAYYGACRTMTSAFGTLRGFSTDHWLDSSQYTPSPDHHGAVTYPVGSHSQKKPNASGGNTWSPGATDEGVLGMANGLEIEGQASSGNQNLVDMTWTRATIDALPSNIAAILEGDSTRLGVVAHHHTDGMQLQLQLGLGSGLTTVAATVNTGSGSGITTSWTATTDLSTGTGSIVARNRQRAGVEGDQSGNYGRIGHYILQNTGMTGITLVGCGVGGSTIDDWTDSVASGGMFDDASLAAHRTALGATCCMVMLGRNNSTATEAALKTKYDALLTRLYGAGYTHVLCIGNFWDQAMTQAQVENLNQAMADAVSDHSGMTASFASPYIAMGRQRMASSLLEGTVHPTQDGADALWGYVESGMFQAGSARQRLRRRGRRRYW